MRCRLPPGGGQNTYRTGVMALDGTVLPAGALQATALSTVTDLFGLVVPTGDTLRA